MVQLYFQILLHEKDKALLEQIQKYFGVGNINTKKENACKYRVSSIKELQVIILHFDQYPLVTKKISWLSII